MDAGQPSSVAATPLGRMDAGQPSRWLQQASGGGLSPCGNLVSRELTLSLVSKVGKILFWKPKESPNVSSVPLPSASENRESRVGHEGPDTRCHPESSRWPALIGEVGASIHGQGFCLFLCLEESAANKTNKFSLYVPASRPYVGVAA
ncbi:hypothetical protein WN51_03897 [Melipona quadrifasciata]|uniref:Uncharacterized protein n=1 Tax=Melipona quadrifasciata TaxID=166423 RepID=A0A0N0BC29_9HYME|nr:hypothetical protein WN51_03897 [Melipona quadrifasciata]